MTIQVLSTVPGIGFNYGAPATHALRVAQFLNDHLSRVVREEPSGRFVGLGTVPLQDTVLATVELRRCVQELGLCGVQIGTSFDGQSLDSPRLEAFWQVRKRKGFANRSTSGLLLCDHRWQRNWTVPSLCTPGI